MRAQRYARQSAALAFTNMCSGSPRIEHALIASVPWGFAHGELVHMPPIPLTLRGQASCPFMCGTSTAMESAMVRLGMYLEMRNPPQWHVPWDQYYGRWLERIGEAEQLGADSVWLAEHHFFDDGHVGQLWTMAAADRDTNTLGSHRHRGVDPPPPPDDRARRAGRAGRRDQRRARRGRLRCGISRARVPGVRAKT